MKKNLIHTTILVLAATALLTVSCKKDEIEIKKSDYSWQVDKDLVDKDIRTRLGYNPKDVVFGYLKQEAMDVPMLSVENGTLPLTGENVRTVIARIEAPQQEDIQLSLTYDASLFDKVKDKYPGYELGEAGLVTIDETTKTLVKGATELTFTLKIRNKSDFDKKRMLPFELKTNNSKVKVVESKSIFVVKLEPQTTQVFVQPTTLGKTFLLDNGSLIGGKNVSISVNSTIALPPGISVGLVRDDTATLPSGRTLAPANIEGTLPKIALSNTQQNLSFELDITKLAVSEAKYTLPLKWVLYDASNNTYEFSDNNIAVNITISNSELTENNRNVYGNYDNDPEGTKVLKRDISFSYYFPNSTIDPQNAIDDDYESYTSFKSQVDGYTQWLFFSFAERKVIKRIRIKVTPEHNIKYVYVAGAQGSTDNRKDQGYAQWRRGGGEYYTINFRNPVPVDHIVLYGFYSDRDRNGAWFNIKEVDFYEE